MKRIVAFGALIVTALLGLVAVVVWYLTAYHGSSLGGMMGGMMGESGTNGMTSAMPGNVWLAFVGFVVVAVVGLVGLVYFLAYPEIKSSPRPAEPESAQEPRGASEQVSWDTLIRTSKPEEKKVLEVLAAHKGSYLQKFVVKESGLSRLKTHRIVSRLAERGVVNVERSGNTNIVSLAPWVTGQPVPQ